ncbi:2',3'-cyclic-nucleotide 3'-phosphodiesterase [Cucurbitaria berberidis CBS 394.84]|uniref:2',3'-cyclic-nucleotide 3'-phosphodiesterase n=1 Tax=Cucurbitaria berberidis CBS 394.84 TaxID=1168544 RepID=A0A9P4G8R4_9PLEO|nr:2',3'-cyclic-nucleotide 3'-phosphodiesterase [Cucurbitaria berberidis CBS 394.84]KAF1841111.1 2',3'-cyclic-nucleotide 3'-phosphodiesterase [Cucurbitaria berberidis CBS 394.84]
MPGSSLWLLPPASHPLNNLLTTLIDKTSFHFTSPHRFLPHVTLTSEIYPSAYGSDPQEWLDSLNIEFGTEIAVEFKKLNSEDVFVRKLYIKCKKDDLRLLALRCRQQVKGFEQAEKAEEWVNELYTPHLSLLYHDCPRIDTEGLSQAGEFAQDLGISVNGQGKLGSWKGGRVVLVQTDKPIHEWKPIAERSLGGAA